MVKKIKNFFKKNILGIIIGGLIFGTAGVYAATYFPSYNVTYDNTESGLSSTDVQGAIDELYNECKTPAMGGDGILEKVPIVTSGDGLYKDEYEDGKYTYKGGNPNNYITFNNERAAWRIISILSDGTIKIMRIESVTQLVWDSSNSNVWSRPSTVNTYLNGTYYNSLTNISQNQIINNNFSVGVQPCGFVVEFEYDTSILVNNENNTKWLGKIALPTISEYVRANSNKELCGTLDTLNDGYNYVTCNQTNWMYGGEYWLLSALCSSQVFSVSDTGTAQAYGNNNYINRQQNDIHPVLYLSSTVKITGGDGSENNPFVIE